jgi:transposase
MRRVEIHLKDEERGQLQQMSSIGVCPVRPLQRAQVLLALDKGISDWQIAEVLNLERTRIWRTRKRYLEGGLEAALYDFARPGRPQQYDDKAQAEIVALACSKPPTGYSQWSLPLLTEVARRQTHVLQTVSQATVRQVLKKNAVSLG